MNTHKILEPNIQNDDDIAINDDGVPSNDDSEPYIVDVDDMQRISTKLETTRFVCLRNKTSTSNYNNWIFVLIFFQLVVDMLHKIWKWKSNSKMQIYKQSRNSESMCTKELQNKS